MDDVSNIPVDDIIDVEVVDEAEEELRKLPIEKRLKSKFLRRIYPRPGGLRYGGVELGYDATLAVDKNLRDTDSTLGCAEYRVVYEACAPGECLDLAALPNELSYSNFVVAYTRSLFDGDIVMCMRDFRLSSDPEVELDEYCGVDILLVEEYIDVIGSDVDQVSRVIRLLSEANRRGGDLKDRVKSVQAVKDACVAADRIVREACEKIDSGVVEYRYSNNLLVDVMLG